MAQFRSKKLPPIPRAPKNNTFADGITTRVMATKQILQLQKDVRFVPDMIIQKKKIFCRVKIKVVKEVLCPAEERQNFYPGP
jgi:hypothetical protein